MTCEVDNAPKLSRRINDEEAAQGDAFLLKENAVVSGNLVASIRQERELEVGSETAFGLGQVGPREMGVLYSTGQLLEYQAQARSCAHVLTSESVEQAGVSGG